MGIDINGMNNSNNSLFNDNNNSLFNNDNSSSSMFDHSSIHESMHKTSFHEDIHDHNKIHESMHFPDHDIINPLNNDFNK